MKNLMEDPKALKKMVEDMIKKSKKKVDIVAETEDDDDETGKNKRYLYQLSTSEI